VTQIHFADGRSAAKAKWEADKCSKRFSFRRKGKTGTKRPVPMTCVKSLATWFYRLNCRNAPTGAYLKWFGHQQDNIYWLCCSGGKAVALSRELLFHQCSRWRNQQNTLWKVVGKAMSCKAGRCRYVQITERCCTEQGNQALVDFFAATEIGKLPPKWITVRRKH